MRTLYFEGAGWFDADTSKATDMRNCRVRTAFTDNAGRKIYLEMSAHVVTKNSSPIVKNFTVACWVTDCFYITGDRDDCNNNRILNRGEVTFEYNKENVLKFVNSLGCNFKDVETLPDLAGYRVFKDGGGINFGDEFQYSEERTARAEEIRRHFYAVEQSEGKKYPNFSLWVDDENPETLHLLRHFNGYNKHWLIYNTENWQETITETTLGRCAC
jgi:hypothetical protein